MRSKSLCGFAGWHPEWIQKFANPKTFIIVYGLLGTTQGMAFLYFISTLTTLEKRFKIPSGTTGIILSGNEISQVLLSLILSYTGGQRNRPRYMSWGVVFCAFSCFILALPHLIFGPGDDALQLTKEYASEYSNSTAINATSNYGMKTSNKLCLGIAESERCDEIFSLVPLALLFLSQFVLGIGNTLYYSLGQSYIDDSSSRKRTPMMLAYAMALRMLGPIAGYGLGYLCLKLYIDPTKTPLIDNKDPRWLGAWWIGWVFLGVLMMLFSLLIRMFPSKMPKKENNQSSNESEPLERKKHEPSHQSEVGKRENLSKLKDLPTALMRLLKNKLLIFNIVSSTFYVLGSTGYVLFLSKYIEVQFNKSPSDATILAGPATLAGSVTGFLVSGIIITRYKPRPSKLFFWNIMIGLSYIMGQVITMSLSCEQSATINVNVNLTSNCNMNCFCDGVDYSPVCSVETGTTFFSPCHAACNHWDNEKRIYAGCSCASENLLPTSEASSTLAIDYSQFVDENYDDGGEKEAIKGGRQKKNVNVNRKNNDFLENIMSPGACIEGCANAFYLFTALMFVINWVGSTGRISNVLLNLRSVADVDKSFSQGLYLMLVSLFANTPGPIIFGYVIDSTCLVWNYKCGDRGHCLLYDQEKFRMYINLTSVALTSVAVFFDVLVWHYAKNINLYGEPDVVGCDKSMQIEEIKIEEIKIEEKQIEPLILK